MIKCHQKKCLVSYIVADPYHFDTDPNPGSEKFRHGSVVRLKFVTDPDPILIRIHKNSGKTAFFKIFDDICPLF